MKKYLLFSILLILGSYTYAQDTMYHKLYIKGKLVVRDSSRFIGDVYVIGDYLSHSNGSSLFGTDAGKVNAGVNNIFFGKNSGYSNTSGTFNSFIGFEAGYNTLTGNGNTIFGYNAGKGVAANSFNFNTLIGDRAGEKISNGNDNTYIGRLAGNSTTTASSNISIGNMSMFSNTTGSVNTAIGYTSLYSNIVGDYNTTLGYGSGYSCLASSNVFIGYNSGYSNTTGSPNSFFGYEAGYSNTTGLNNTYLGYKAGYVNSTVNNVTAIGHNSGQNNTGALATFLGSGSGQNNTGNYNTFLGYQSGVANTSGNQNTFSGVYSGDANIDGSRNVFSGMESGHRNTSGSFNVAYGAYSMNYNTTGSHNTAIGEEAGYQIGTNSEGISGDNTFLGYNAGRGGASVVHFKSFSTAIGSGSLQNDTVNNNTAVGFNSGYNNLSGANNAYFGHTAGYSNLTGSNNVFIGYQAGYNETRSNHFYLWNGLINSNLASDTTHSLLYGTFATTNKYQQLTINGLLNVSKSKQDSLILGGDTLTGAVSFTDYLGNLGNSINPNDTAFFKVISNPAIKLNGAVQYLSDTLTRADATPSVTGKNIWKYSATGNTVPVTITDLDNPVPGTIYTFIGQNDTGLMNFVDGGNFFLSGSVNFSLGVNDVLVLYCVADNHYIEISRSDN